MIYMQCLITGQAFYERKLCEKSRCEVELKPEKSDFSDFSGFFVLI